jgi:hypothetical protein
LKRFERLYAILAAADLANSKVDVIFSAPGTPAAIAARGAGDVVVG